MNTLRLVAMMVLIFQIIFSKPQWCKEKGQNIDVERNLSRKTVRKTPTM